MKAICAWCNKALGEREPLDDPQITHGICPACQRALDWERERIRDNVASEAQDE